MSFRDDHLSRALAAEARTMELESRLREYEDLAKSNEEKQEDLRQQVAEARANKGFITNIQAFFEARRKRREARPWEYRNYREKAGTFAGVCGIGFVLGTLWYIILNSPGEGLPGGFVTNLRHHHEFTTHSTVCHGTRPRVCTPVSTNHPEKWVAIVCNEGVCERHSYSESDWSALHDGGWTCLRRGCQPPAEHEEVYNED